MRRHIVVCRESQSSPASFVIVDRFSGENGWEWAQRSGVPSQLEACIRQLLSELNNAFGDGLPDATITTGDKQSLMDDPPLHHADGVLSAHPGGAFTMLMPIRIERPERSRLEFWAMVSRHLHGLTGEPMLSASNRSPGIFVQRLLCDAILSLFGAGETRVMGSEPTFREFANPLKRPTEILVRPMWRAADLLPEVFPPPREPLPAFDPFANLTPEQRSGAERAQAVKQAKKHVKGMWQSRGFTFNKATQAWSPPKS